MPQETVSVSEKPIPSQSSCCAPAFAEKFLELLNGKPKTTLPWRRPLRAWTRCSR